MGPTANRRHFLSGALAAGAVSSGAIAAVNGSSAPPPPDGATVRHRDLKVTDLKILQLVGKGNQRSLYLKLATTEGVEGLYGPIDYEVAVFVDRFMRRSLIGKDPLAHEAHWDRLFRDSRHSRGSHYLMALSALDNALWDLRGRLFGQPVYRLLGGDRQKVQAYGSCLGFSHEPEAMQSKARALKEQGFDHQKWFLRDIGPKDGPRGLTQNVETVRLLRDAVGEDTDLMFDAYWQWDLPYATAWAKRAEPYHPRWIEEPFPTANLDAFIELSQETSIPVATGEHFYGRWDVQKFLAADAIRVVQADPEWCGGVSELVKMCAIASVHGAHVIPHGHSLHAAMHVVASQPLETCPLIEYLINKMEGAYYSFEKQALRPRDGWIDLPDRPGFGIELDESKIEDIQEFRLA